MDELQLRSLLEALARGETTQTDALEKIKAVPFEGIGDYAKLDLQRTARNGFPEVIFGQGKTPEQVTEILRRLMEHSSRGMATCISAEMAAEVGKATGRVDHGRGDDVFARIQGQCADAGEVR